MLVHENAVTRIPHDVSLTCAALIGCAVLTGFGAVVRTAKVVPGSTVAVIGCGGIGLNCVQGAHLAGASRIIGIDNNPGKLAFAKLFGATDVIDASLENPVGAVRRLVPRRRSPGVDFSFEAVRSASTTQQAFSMLTKGGLATIIGLMAPGTIIALDGAELTPERRIQGCAMGSTRFEQDVAWIIALYRQGRLKLDELISAEMILAEINDGFDQMASGKFARSVIVFDH
jgi:S-(hydroxymethyl)glutathione dehydrogenase/alcohol dehydrogenase